MKIFSLLLLAFFINTNLYAQKDLVVSDDQKLQNQETVDALDAISKTTEKPWDKGFFLDLVTGIGTKNTLWFAGTRSGAPILSNQLVSGTSIRFGNKWYFRTHKKFKPGIQAIWARVGVLVPFGQVTGSIDPALSTLTSLTLQPLNIGSTNLWIFSEHAALELNFNIGLHSMFTPINRENTTALQLGVLVNPCVKLRYKKFAIGLDLSYMLVAVGSRYESGQPADSYPYEMGIDLLGLTVGFKL